MFKRTEKWANGDHYSPVHFYECDSCKKEICESNPHEEVGDCHYCWECSFINGLIDGVKYMRYSGFSMSGYKVGIHEGKIHFWNTVKPPWEQSNKDIRRTKQYREWRRGVLSRDNHKCQHCGSEEDLHAHHIKEFAKHKKLRFKVSNGLTLCEKCHRAEHRKTETG